MSGLLLPRTDAGVAAQALVITLLIGVALWRAWSRPELRLLVIGGSLVVVGLLGLRAAH